LTRGRFFSERILSGNDIKKQTIREKEKGVKKTPHDEGRGWGTAREDKPRISKINEKNKKARFSRGWGTREFLISGKKNKRSYA